MKTKEIFVYGILPLLLAAISTVVLLLVPATTTYGLVSLALWVIVGKILFRMAIVAAVMFLFVLLYFWLEDKGVVHKPEQR